MRVTVDHGAETVTMTGTIWPGITFPFARLPGWIAFHERCAAREGGRYAAIHEPRVRALKAAQREIDARRAA